MTVNVFEMMEEAIAEEKKQRKNRKIHMNKFTEEYFRIANGLIVVQEWIMRIHFDGVSSLDISVSGDHHAFKGTFGALSKLGYKPSKRPKEEKLSAWNGWFYNHDGDHPIIWVTFSSTKCTRKKVGTKMVEQDIYEIVCE